MIGRNSRYRNARSFEDSDGVLGDFKGLRPREISTATGVIEHTIAAGDRFDRLALRYYNDTRKWWRILDANPNILYAGDLFQESNRGTVILIPRVSETNSGI